MVAGRRASHTLLFARRVMRLKISKKRINESPAVRIADFRFAGHRGQLVRVLLGLLFLFVFSSVRAQQAGENSKPTDSPASSNASSKSISTANANAPLKFELSERDLSDTAASFKSDDSKAAVGNFKAEMPAAVTDVKTRSEILRQLPETVQKLKIEDSEPAEKLRKVIAPVLQLYGREKIYDIVIFRHATPIMFSDSGVVLVVSTGMIERAASDDELLGYTAHEVAPSISLAIRFTLNIC